MPTILLQLDSEETLEIKHDESNTYEVDRCDFFPVKIGSIKKTDEGYLKGEAPIARVGILKYLLPDGSTRHELVPPDTLFNKDSMDSLKLQPVTDTHPKEILLDSKTVKRRRVGTTGETVKQDGEFLVTALAITDDDAIRNVESGRQQLSPGYKALLVMQSGTFRGQRYDAVQIKRTYNHVAICDRARGGSDLRLNLDAFDIEEIEKLDGFEISNNQLQKESNMPKFRIDGIDYDAAQEVINFISKLQSNCDAIQGKLDTANADSQKLQAKVDELTEKNDSLSKRDINKEIREGVTKRLGLLKVAQTVLDQKEHGKLDSMTDAEIKSAVIKAKFPSANLDGKTEVYIDARFDSISETLEFDPDAIGRSRQASGKRADGENTDPVEKAKKDSEDRILKAYELFGSEK